MKRVIVFLSSIVIIVISILLLLMGQSKSNDMSLAEETTQPFSAMQLDSVTKPLTDKNEAETILETSEDASEVTTEASDMNVTVPETLALTIALVGKSPEEIERIGCRQLITVESSGSTAQINFYRLIDKAWIRDENLSCSGFVGANGVTEDMHEGSYATPKGCFSISEAFYVYEPPTTGLSLFQITNDTYWIDDPDSAYYNRRIEGTENIDWNSAEHMIDYTVAYEYGFVVDYNTEAIYNAGSAIFFHVSYSPTAGCIGTNRDMVLKYLEALNLNEQPYIIIV